MPPYMRDELAGPLSLTRRQYAELIAYLAYPEYCKNLELAARLAKRSSANEWTVSRFNAHVTMSLARQRTAYLWIIVIIHEQLPHIPAGTTGFIPPRAIFPLWRELLEDLVGHNKGESVTGAGNHLERAVGEQACQTASVSHR
jgi:hypothetical protein